jgi:hypothetical protein
MLPGTRLSGGAAQDTRLSLGLVNVSKREFFRNFYTAFNKTFTEANIRSGWHNTGVNPFDREQVLKIFMKDEEGLQASTPSTNHSNSCLDSPSAMRTMRRVVNEEVAHMNVQSQSVVIWHLTCPKDSGIWISKQLGFQSSTNFKAMHAH